MAATRNQLQQHLAALRAAYTEAYAAGDWDRADYVALCIDDTEVELAKNAAARSAA